MARLHRLIAGPFLLLLVACGPDTAPFALSLTPGRLELGVERPMRLTVQTAQETVAETHDLEPGQPIELVVHQGRLLLQGPEPEPLLLDASLTWDPDFEAVISEDGRVIGLHPQTLPPERRSRAPISLHLQPR
jgi:hypothetical protein